MNQSDSSKNYVYFDLYHTCKNTPDSGSKAPFKARENGNHWLGDGWYFWLESPFYAKNWGKTSPAYKETGYLVLQYKLSIKREDLLDLVGSPYDQNGFLKAFKEFKDIPQHKHRSITVSGCIGWLQKQNKWEWLATKLADFGNIDTLVKKSTKIARGGEITFLRPRVQVCIHNLKGVDLKRQEVSCKSKQTSGIFKKYRKVNNEQV